MQASFNDTLARWMSRAMYALCVAAAVSIIAFLVLITGYILYRGADSLWNARSVFFTENPIANTADPDYPGGMRSAIEGTAFMVGMASLAGVPIGILAGIFLAEYDVGSRLAAPVRFFADVLSGVPSIVVGVLRYELLVVPVGRYNARAGAMALAFIMIPLVARTTEEMLRLVPGSYREASIALGATKARTILRVVLPSVTGSIVTGIMLAVARIAGETAPLLFTALGARQITGLKEPFPSLTVQIYNYATGPYAAEKSMAWAGILVLVLLVLVLNLLIRYATRQARPAA